MTPEEGKRSEDASHSRQMKVGSKSTLGQAALLAVLYFASGKLGLLFAIPPGYVTVIWPPSGIVLGMLLLYGARLWPGVLIGSFLLNLSNAGLPADFTLEQALTPTHWFAALVIAAGATVQGLVGRALIARYLGLPLRFDYLRQLIALIALGGPLACLIQATVGVGALWSVGALSTSQLVSHWLMWWGGDVLGVIVFLPLVLIWPSEQERMTWRGTAVRSLPVVAMVVLIVPLGLTFYAWKIAAQLSHDQAEAEFASLASEHERTLLHRLDSYQTALLGGAGFFQGSISVSRAEWRRYVEALQVERNFPGVNGIGWIEAVAPDGVPEFLKRVREDGAPLFEIRPSADISPHYVITYIEPIEVNGPAVGLNIAFEPNRLQAANLSRDTGKPAITQGIVLVQDEQKTAGFLLLHPIYRDDMPTATVADRRAALKGWIYAPFIAKNVFNDLSAEAGRTHTLKIYDGTDERPEKLIYSNASERSSAPAYTVRNQLEVMQQQWTVVWESGPTFERREQTNAPLYVLIGGLLFTTLFALFLVGMTLHRTETIEWMAGEGRYALSVGVFLLLAIGSYTAFRSLEQAELTHVRERVQGEVAKVGLLLDAQVNERLFALRRMAQRWQAAGGTSQPLWQADARNYLKQLGGLQALEWVDATHHIRWVEPLAGNEQVVGLNVLLDGAGTGAPEHTPSKNAVTVTPPLELSQGYMAFLAYQPLMVEERFDGFLVGVFAIDDFFRSAISTDTADSYALAVEYEGKTYFSNGVAPNLQERQFGIEHRFLLNDKQWVLRLVPTREFIASQRGALPVAVLIAGMLIAVLTAISLRYILMSRLKSARLVESNNLNMAILASTPYLVIATDQQGKVITFNQAAEKALGYSADEIVGRETPSLWHDPAEVAARAAALSEELHETVRPGFEVLVSKSLHLGIHSSEWTFIRKDGSRFPGNLTVTTLRDHRGVPTGYLGVVEDITQRSQMERLKNEFISVVSHELRTPLTSIRGSLGLLLGAFKQELPQKVKALIEIAYNNCERLIPLINDILDIDKIASGHMRFEMQEESVAALTMQAVQANEAYARKFNVSISVAPIDEKLRIVVDAARYQQVLSNLLSNAAKFSPAGGVIEVSAEARDGRASIAVRDYGEGISENFQSRIFGKFSQADSSATRAKGGTGLGLHIAKQLVERMKGTIEFTTTLGMGTTFRVEFPLAAKTPSQNSSAVLHFRERRQAGADVLHIEDDADLGNLVATALQGKATTFTATSLAEAEALLEKKTFSMILLDMKLPDGSGVELLERMHELSDSPPPVVILAADEPPADVSDKAAAVMVKTRTSEAAVVQTVLDVLRQVREEKQAGQDASIAR
jgi:PAS domain S-box-containing protein